VCDCVCVCDCVYANACVTVRIFFLFDETSGSFSTFSTKSKFIIRGTHSDLVKENGRESETGKECEGE